MSRRLLRVSAVGAAAAGLTLSVLTGAAGAVADDDSSANSTSASATKADQQRAAAYWTPERMRAAEPMDQEMTAEKVDSPEATQPSVGEPRTVAPTAAADADPMAFPELGAAWDGGGEVTESVGRVFFSYGGQDSACSATVVTSDNQSTVFTAGHCVFMDGSFHDNWIFVPGYDNGDAPFGEWPAEELFAHEQWEQSEDMHFDLGAAVVGETDGQTIQETVGAQGIAFNQERHFDAYAMGYPAQDQWDGEELIYSSGTTFDDTAGGTDNIGIDSNQTGGTSGGPWFADFDEDAGAGVVNSVNSYGYIFQPDVLYGPYFGEEAEAFYDSVQG